MKRASPAYGASHGSTKKRLRSQTRRCAGQDIHRLCRLVIFSFRDLCRIPSAQQRDIYAERRWYPQCGVARDSAVAAAAYAAQTVDASHHGEGAAFTQAVIVRQSPRPRPPPPPSPAPPPPPPRRTTAPCASYMVGGPPRPTRRTGQFAEEGITYCAYTAVFECESLVTSRGIFNQSSAIL